MLPQESIKFLRLDDATLQTIFENKLSSEHIGFALIFEQGEHKAILSTLVVRPVDVTGILELTSLFTRPEVRRQGLARRLLVETLACVRETMKRYLYVFVQTALPHFFERCGFTRNQLLPKPTYFPYIVKCTSSQLKTLALSLGPALPSPAQCSAQPRSEREDVEIFLGLDEREKEIWRVGFRLATSSDGLWVLVDYGQSPRRYQEWLPCDYFRLRVRVCRTGASGTGLSSSASFRKRPGSEESGLVAAPPAKKARSPQVLPAIVATAEEISDAKNLQFTVLKEDAQRGEAYSLLVESLSCVGETHLELCLFNDADWRFAVAGLLLKGGAAEPAAAEPGAAEPGAAVLASVVVYREHRQFNFVELAFFATRKELRKAGLGQRLFEQLERQWKKENYEYVLTFADFAAVPFFQTKLEFSEEPVLPKVLYSSWIDRYNLAELMTKRLWRPESVESVTVVDPPLPVTVLVGKVNMKKSSKIIRRGWALAETDDLVCVEYEVWPRKHREWLKKDSGRWRLEKAGGGVTHSAVGKAPPAPPTVTREEVMDLHPVVFDHKVARKAQTQPAQQLETTKKEEEEEGVRYVGEVAWLPESLAKSPERLADVMAALREERRATFAAMVVASEELMPLLEELGLSCKAPEDYPACEKGSGSVAVADLRM